MPMTLIITRNVEDRYKGFLSSVMLEIAPGIFTAPNLSSSVRERIWTVLIYWHSELQKGSIIMTWPDSKQVGKQAIKTLGEPKRELVDIDGIFIVKQTL